MIPILLNNRWRADAVCSWRPVCLLTANKCIFISSMARQQRRLQCKGCRCCVKELSLLRDGAHLTCEQQKALSDSIAWDVVQHEVVNLV